jgi:hypothetical protein
LQAGDDLDGAGAVANDADPLVAEVVAGLCQLEPFLAEGGKGERELT